MRYQMRSFALASFIVLAAAAIFARDDKSPVSSSAIPPEWKGKMTDASQLPVETNSWGTLQWLCSEKLMPGAEQTVGIATIFAGKKNPLHYHPNCEEIVYILSGEGLQNCDGNAVHVKAGMTIRIPPKVKHNIVNTGTETLRSLITYSSGDRQVVFMDEQPPK